MIFASRTHSNLWSARLSSINSNPSNQKWRECVTRDVDLISDAHFELAEGRQRSYYLRNLKDNRLPSTRKYYFVDFRDDDEMSANKQAVASVAADGAITTDDGVAALADCSTWRSNGSDCFTKCDCYRRKLWNG